MLGVRTYSREYIGQCRSKIAEDVAAFRRLVEAAEATSPSPDSTLHTSLESFEATYFNNMVLVLDALFVHRLRTVEGKDGNPLNEVRIICDSIAQNGAAMLQDKAIKLAPETSVLHYRPGDTIRLTAAGFETLSSGFLAEIERKYL